MYFESFLTMYKKQAFGVSFHYKSEELKQEENEKQNNRESITLTVLCRWH